MRNPGSLLADDIRTLKHIRRRLKGQVDDLKRVVQNLEGEVRRWTMRLHGMDPCPKWVRNRVMGRTSQDICERRLWDEQRDFYSNNLGVAKDYLQILKQQVMSCPDRADYLRLLDARIAQDEKRLRMYPHRVTNCATVELQDLCDTLFCSFPFCDMDQIYKLARHLRANEIDLKRVRTIYKTLLGQLPTGVLETEPWNHTEAYVTKRASRPKVFPTMCLQKEDGQHFNKTSLEDLVDKVKWTPELEVFVIEQFSWSIPPVEFNACKLSLWKNHCFPWPPNVGPTSLRHKFCHDRWDNLDLPNRIIYPTWEMDARLGADCATERWSPESESEGAMTRTQRVFVPLVRAWLVNTIRAVALDRHPRESILDGRVDDHAEENWLKEQCEKTMKDGTDVDKEQAQLDYKQIFGENLRIPSPPPNTQDKEYRLNQNQELVEVDVQQREPTDDMWLARIDGVTMHPIIEGGPRREPSSSSPPPSISEINKINAEAVTPPPRGLDEHMVKAAYASMFDKVPSDAKRIVLAEGDSRFYAIKSTLPTLASKYFHPCYGVNMHVVGATIFKDTNEGEPMTIVVFVDGAGASRCWNREVDTGDVELLKKPYGLSLIQRGAKGDVANVPGRHTTCTNTVFFAISRRSQRGNGVITQKCCNKQSKHNRRNSTQRIDDQPMCCAVWKGEQRCVSEDRDIIRDMFFTPEQQKDIA